VVPSSRPWQHPSHRSRTTRIPLARSASPSRSRFAQPFSRPAAVRSAVGWFSRKPKEASPPRRRAVHSIRRDVLQLIIGASKSQHPKEFGAFMRAEKGVITEILLAPGRVAGNAHTIFSVWNMPVDASICGSVHSHPSPYPIPSDADKQFFSHTGHTHIIIASPYTEKTWRAYDATAAPIELAVVDG